MMELLSLFSDILLLRILTDHLFDDLEILKTNMIDHIHLLFAFLRSSPGRSVRDIFGLWPILLFVTTFPRILEKTGPFLAGAEHYLSSGCIFAFCKLFSVLT